VIRPSALTSAAAPSGTAFLNPVTDLCAWATAHVKELDSVRRCRAEKEGEG